MSFYEGKNVLVTGGTGMIGSHLTELLVQQGAHVAITEHNTPAHTIFSKTLLNKITIHKADLTKPEDCQRVVKGADYVFQLAAVLTGVMGNLATPVKMLTPNLLIQTNMIEAAHHRDIDRYFFTSSACIYPSTAPSPLEETEGLQGQPDKNNAAHAWAKRIGEIQAGYYHQEYGMPIAIGRPFNSYGPRDNFHHITSHAIAALIKRAEAREAPFTIWGDGTATRDFVYVTDIAQHILTLLEKHPKADPINIASGREVTILDLAKLILKLTGYTNAAIQLSPDKPAGQQRRIGSTAKAEKFFGIKTTIPLEEGLKKTIAWYRTHRDTIKAYET